MRNGTTLGVVTFPISYTRDYYSLSLIQILEGLFGHILLITGEVGDRYANGRPKVRVIRVLHTQGIGPSRRVLNYIVTQVRMAQAVAKHSREVDTWVFHNGGDGLLLALLSARLHRKRSILILTGLPATIMKTAGDPLSAILLLLTHLGFLLSTEIVAHSGSMASEAGLDSWTKKTSVAHEHFVELDASAQRKPIGARQNIVGYVGRLSVEKGVLEFVEAAKDISAMRSDIDFSLAGVGPLETRIRALTRSEHLESRVRLLGLIPHELMFDHLRELKLLVLPSYTESLPTIMVEAFAAGTPVLATAVGSIPDFLQDERTGFILSENSPRVIASRVIQILSRPDLDSIAENALKVARSEFSYEHAVENFRRVLVQRAEST